MSFNKVKIYHGICTTFHSMEHKPQLVRGLQDRLLKLGYQVVLVKVPYVNYCMIEICSFEVFRCNLKSLQFNTHYASDLVAQRAIAAVVHTSTKFIHARNYMWLKKLIEEAIFTRGPHAPKDYWPDDVEIKPYATCNECVACCDILVKKKEMKEPTSV